MAPPGISLSPETLALIREHPVFDAHVDSLQRALDLGHDLGCQGPGQLDLERGRAGGLGSVVFVSWVDPKYIDLGPHGARDRTRGLLREFHRLARRHPERMRFAGNGRELETAHAAGAVAGIPGIEGGHSIEGSLEELAWFFEHGVRVLTLVWNNHLAWIRSCQPGAGAGISEGLSEFGCEVVRTMNRLGMVVDVSHAGERSFFDALEASAKPVIASHSGCRAVNDHPRNLTDDQLRLLRQNGGVVGMVFCTAFLSSEAQAEERRVRATDAYRAIGGSNDTERFLHQSEFLERSTTPLPAERVLDHLCHAVEVAGIEHVGLGSDYDGIQRAPHGLEHAGCYPVLAELLLRRGFDVREVEQVLGANMQRVFEAATGPGTRAWDAELATIDD